MLQSFWTSNYRNLRMSKPVKWEKGISFVLGGCGAGKTNLCVALSDIVTESWNYQEKQPTDFHYGFLEEENEICMQYHRRSDGMVDSIELHIPEYHFSYCKDTFLHKPTDIWHEFCKAAIDSAIKVELCKWCRKLEKEISVVVPEKFRNKIFYNESRIGRVENAEIKLKNSFNRIIIVDDGEMYGETQLADFLQMVRNNEAQAIVVVRRSKWFEQRYATERNYYLVEEGEVKPISDCIGKDIKSVKELKNLFLKRAFGI